MSTTFIFPAMAAPTANRDLFAILAFCSIGLMVSAAFVWLAPLQMAAALAN